MVDVGTLFRQAKMTSKEYFEDAREYLDKEGFKDLKFDDYMRLAELSADDFKTMASSRDVEKLSIGLSSIERCLDRILTIMEKTDA